MHGPSSERPNEGLLSDEGQTLETLDYTTVLAVYQPFYISICISTLPTQHTCHTHVYELWPNKHAVVWFRLSFVMQFIKGQGVIQYTRNLQIAFAFYIWYFIPLKHWHKLCNALLTKRIIKRYMSLSVANVTM